LGVLAPAGNELLMLSTGYCNVLSARINVRRLLVLYLQLLFYNESIRFGLHLVLDPESTPFEFFPEPLDVILGGSWRRYWYLIVYFQISFLAPALNHAARSFSFSEYKLYVTALAIIGFLRCGVSEDWNLASLEFNRPLFFIAMYMIGAFLRLHGHGITNLFASFAFSASFTIRFLVVREQWLWMIPSFLDRFKCAFGPAFNHGRTERGYPIWDTFLSPIFVTFSLVLITRISLPSKFGNVGSYLGRHGLAVWLISQQSTEAHNQFVKTFRMYWPEFRENQVKRLFNLIRFICTMYMICIAVDGYRWTLFEVGERWWDWGVMSLGRLRSIVKLVKENRKRLLGLRSYRRLLRTMRRYGRLRDDGGL
jgi:hypothetical protein